MTFYSYYIISGSCSLYYKIVIVWNDDYIPQRKFNSLKFKYEKKTIVVRYQGLSARLLNWNI